MMKFRQYVQVTSALSAIGNIIKLPCVEGCYKLNGNLVYGLGYVRTLGDCYANKATDGQWLCENTDGLWYLLEDAEFNELMNNN